MHPLLIFRGDILSKQSIYLRRLVVSSVFLAIALVLRMFFSFYMPLFGEAGMRVGISGIFVVMPAILFGPLFGGLTSGLMDILGFMMRPVGNYLPLMGVVVTLGGVIRGAMWLILRGRAPGKLRIIVLMLAVSMLVFGFANMFMLRASGVNVDFYENIAATGAEIDTSNMFFIARWLIARTQDVSNPSGMLSSMITTVTMGPIGAAAFGFVLAGIDFFISSKLRKELSNNENTSIMPLLLAMLTGSWFVNTLNTVILREMLITSWQLIPFAVVWLPRIIETTISTTVYAFFVALLLNVCKRQRAIQQLMR